MKKLLNLRAISTLLISFCILFIIPANAFASVDNGQAQTYTMPKQYLTSPTSINITLSTRQ